MDVETFNAILEKTPLVKQMAKLVAAGDESAFESQTKRQHFVPRFILARFARKDRGHDYVFQLDVRRGKPERIRPKDAASQIHFYAVLDEEGNQDNRIEGFLALTENHAAPALRRLRENPANLSESDRAMIAFFLALLNSRTPGGTATGAANADVTMRMLHANSLSDEASFAQMYRERFPDESDENIEELRMRMLEMLKTDEVGYSDPRAAAWQLSFSLAGDIAAHVFDMRWTLLVAKDAMFVTSDRGLAMFDPDPPYPWTGSAWASSPRAQTTIPLSTSMCLQIQPGKATLDISEVGADVVEEINLRTYGWAADYVYGETQEAVVAVRRAAKEHPALVRRPKPNYQVVLVDADPENTTLADQHRARGWPPQLYVLGKAHDYFVIGLDGDAVEGMVKTTEIVKRRERRKLGLRDDEPLPGGPDVDPVRLGW